MAHFESASIQCQKCGMEVRKKFLVRNGEHSIRLLQDYAAGILLWTIADDLILCPYCASGAPGSE